MLGRGKTAALAEPSSQFLPKPVKRILALQADGDALELGATLQVAVDFGQEDPGAAVDREVEYTRRDRRKRDRLQSMSIGQGQRRTYG